MGSILVEFHFFVKQGPKWRVKCKTLPPFQAMEGKDMHWHFVGFPESKQRPCHAAVRALCTAHTMLSDAELSDWSVVIKGGHFRFMLLCILSVWVLTQIRQLKLRDYLHLSSWKCSHGHSVHCSFEWWCPVDPAHHHASSSRKEGCAHQHQICRHLSLWHPSSSRGVGQRYLPHGAWSWDCWWGGGCGWWRDQVQGRRQGGCRMHGWQLQKLPFMQGRWWELLPDRCYHDLQWKGQVPALWRVQRRRWCSNIWWILTEHCGRWELCVQDSWRHGHGWCGTIALRRYYRVLTFHVLWIEARHEVGRGWTWWFGCHGSADWQSHGCWSDCLVPFSIQEGWGTEGTESWQICGGHRWGRCSYREGLLWLHDQYHCCQSWSCSLHGHVDLQWQAHPCGCASLSFGIPCVPAGCSKKDDCRLVDRRHSRDSGHVGLLRQAWNHLPLTNWSQLILRKWMQPMNEQWSQMWSTASSSIPLPFPQLPQLVDTARWWNCETFVQFQWTTSR